MRRKDREITDKKVMLDIIKRAEACFMAMSNDNKPYIVPMNFGYEDNAVFFHCALNGKKIEMIRNNPQVCLLFTVDNETSLIGAPETWTTYYKSVIAYGKAEIVEDLIEKQKGINAFLKHYSGNGMDFENKLLDKVMIIRVNIEKMTGKGNIPKDE